MGEDFFLVCHFTCLRYLFYCPDFAMQKISGAGPLCFMASVKSLITHLWSSLWQNMTHAELLIFSCLLSEYSLVDWYLCSSEILSAVCGLMVTFISFITRVNRGQCEQKNKKTPHCSLSLMTLFFIPHSRMFFCLLPSHAFN